MIAPFAIAEATYMVGQRLGASVEARFLAALAAFEVEPLPPEDLIRMAELVEQYSDFPLGGSDAAVVAIAERLGAETIVTLDRRHFSVIRPRHVDAFTLLP